MAKYITHIQLKAARHSLNMGVRDIAKLLKVSKATISKTEIGKTRDFLYKHSAALSVFFESHHITFPNEYSIRYQPECNEAENLSHKSSFITRFQLVTARHILNVTQDELARIIHIDKGVISRAEILSNKQLINPQDQSVISKLKDLFNQRGIEFPDKLYIFFKKYIDNTLTK